MSVFRWYNNRVVYNHNPMFVRDAANALLGTYGQKKTPVVGKNGIDIHSDGPLEGLRIDPPSGTPQTAVFDSNFTFDHIGEMNLPLKAFNLGIDDALSYQMLHRGFCKFMHHAIAPDRIKEVVNNDPSLVADLRERKRLRFVTSVIFVKELLLFSSKDHDFDVQGDLDLGLPIEDIEEAAANANGGSGGPKGKGYKRPDDAPFKLSVDGDDSGGETRKLGFEYGPGTIFAYGLHKPIWDKKNKGKRTAITGWQSDWQGVN